MYDWLADALQGSSHVVTASRRLARVLLAEYGNQQIANEKSAWRTPAILAWSDWLATLLATAEHPQQLPIRINAFQSRLLWERCLRREISDPLLNIALLARQSSDAWSRLHEWLVSVQDCEDAAYGKDKQLFVRAAKNYQSILDHEDWIDHALLPTLVKELIEERRVVLPPRAMFVGFDRIVPQAQALLDTLEGAGCGIAIAKTTTVSASSSLHCYENSAAELRAAGAWARQALERSPQQGIAVVIANLEQDAPRYARLLKEGLLPGWQYAGSRYEGAVNVSYGSKLATYPAIAIATLALRWLHSDLATPEVSTLLRTPVLGRPEIDGRSRLELKLRQMPDRAWSPQMLHDVATGNRVTDDASDWLWRIRSLIDHRNAAPRRQSPAAWAELFDTVLNKLNWPGSGTLSSFEFQLVNRWRELLNDLARLELVTSTMTMAEAQGRLATLTRETVYQPEAEGAVVHLVGPLEAAGMQLDKLWVAGLSARNWPPPGRPLALVSRDLQRDRGMPDADPKDTLEYAHRVFARLMCSANEVVISYPKSEGDAEQTVAGLISEFDLEEKTGPADPHWHAARLRSVLPLTTLANEQVPAVSRNELVAGGALTIQRQLHEPFAAFVYGRLGVQLLRPISAGLAANIRGNLIHAALHQLYKERPGRDEIVAWDSEEVARRIDAALNTAFGPHARLADPLLKQLLSLEKNRVRDLMMRVIELDRSRDAFDIDSVETTVDAEINGIRLQLRYDRIDRHAAGGIIILDYKTGHPKRLLNRDKEPNDIQLVVYACAINRPVEGIGLVNIDSRAVNIEIAGRTFTPAIDWDAALSRWRHEVNTAAGEIADGDVRINGLQTVQAARPLGLLSRYRDLSLDA